MSLVDLIMPKLGESIMEATILKWHKQIGDKIAMDETVLDIATDKVDSEVPSTAAGILESILFNVDDVVPIGAVIAKIKVVSSNESQPINPSSSTEPKKEYEEVKIVEEIPFQPTATTSQSNNNGMRFYSPLVLNIAQSEGISMADLEKIPGTGQDGRVTKKDILAYVANPSKPAVIAVPIEPAKVEVIKTNVEANVKPAQEMAPVVYPGNIEIIEMDRMRKLIAKHMVDSKHTSPHVTSFAECDVTNLVL
jgi:2-oxoglutarate dehydrogenase E2 component (dihydrolipoamide succinyltransferase)